MNRIAHAPIFMVAAVVSWQAAAVEPAPSGPIEAMSARLRLLKAYPAAIEKVENNEIVFRNGKRMPYDDGKGEKSFDDWLASPDVEDMFSIQYVLGELSTPPSKNFDPGRARNEEFFRAVYGDCRNGEVTKNMVDVKWLSKKSLEIVKFSNINGAAERLAAVSDELDALPDKFDVYLRPTAGTYNCRVVAGTNSYSAHSYGIAIDISLKHAHYWRWSKDSKYGAIAYKNEIPFEIVRIFEKHGFVWGGKWYHYDTMHFEYRPELVPPEVPLPSKASP